MLGRSRTSLGPPGSFAVAAKGVEDSIRTLWDSIRSMQRDYAKEAGALATPDPAKDAAEAQVAAFVKRVGGYIDRLKEAVAAAQKGRRGPAPEGGGGEEPQQQRANEQTVAHMTGVVLILAEHLHRAAMALDRLRAARYQALLDKRGPGMLPPAPAAASAATAAVVAAAAASTSGRGGAKQDGDTAPRYGPVASARAAAMAVARSGWQHMLGGGGSSSSNGNLASSAAAAAAAGGKSGGETGPTGLGLADGTDGGPEVWPEGQAQEVEQENKALLERLTATRNAAFSVEQSVRDVAALNQMFSTAVLAQAETIESIYMAAVEATHNITRGNESLTKTVAINRSSTRHILVLLLLATACLLFFDWFNS
ncbi:hypothetical protein HYH02_004500 [Chlamydomonas schloesseri]|uniref:t-SNARE coiled-coil homology domain-containing protein n=1 Tax=Chlamydomonas schloesseri TaxID=2026947 RepID=A0A835WQ60_9CHLO|nr:hypothetical protein HYH02_004500 [Chlamydomonas schloesseri]|eukprot:KAG2450660.1 hypothetical protein HYH02_004500 [Chlamydomonas schloesseri]